MAGKSREEHVRRRLASDGYRLIKSNRRNAGADDDGGYCIVDEHDFVAAGPRFDLSLDDVEAFAAE